MAILNIPDRQFQTEDPEFIRLFLQERGIFYDRWEAAVPLADDAEQETVLAAYAHVLKPYMEANGYQTADVLNIHAQTPNYPAIRAKFLSEHTHTEDEVRFFVDGQGHFWFHLDTQTDPVFNVLCQRGDLISVPAGTKHWFDAGAEQPFVKAIRIFIDASGWVPHYTHSDVAQRYENLA